ncbi:MAG TPA: hypothetical protein VNI83_13970 [Vicinamibacterales bacterium]|nr:hypothetical protein [Vicinamibacterales bacterium]
MSSWFRSVSAVAGRGLLALFVGLFLLVLLLSAAFAGSPALVVWFAVLAVEIWLFVRDRLRLRTYALAVAAPLFVLCLALDPVVERLVARYPDSTAVGLILLTLYYLPVPVGMWLAVRGLRR